MTTRRWLAYIASALIAAATVPSSADSQELGLQARVQSDYKLRSMRAVRQPIVQPRVWSSWNGTRIDAYGNYEVEDKHHSFTSIVASHKISIGPADISGWYANIIFESEPDVRGTQEFGARISSGRNPQVAISAAYDFEQGNAWYFESAANMEFDTGSRPADLGIVVRADTGYFRERAGLSHLEANLGTTWSWAGMEFSPGIACGIDLGSEGSSECIAGMSISYMIRGKNER